MLDVIDQTDTEVSALLAGAAKTIQAVRYCWLVTNATTGFNARPMGRVLPDKSEDGWIVRFVTDGRSRKAHELSGGREAGLIFQSDPDEAYVALFGKARLLERAQDVERFWRKHYEAYFPTPADRAAAASSKSTSAGWNSGFAASRRSRSDCMRPSSRAMPAGRGRRHEHAFMTMAK